jgi:phage-related protein (TIGR01555 family)
MNFIRAFQSNEGLTLMDSKDEFEAHQYTFAGLDNVLLQFGQQIAGALQIPLVRLFGQSPTGLNSSGESDLRTYYDNVLRLQERQLRSPLNLLLDLTARSVLGHPLPKGFKYRFNPLWQLTEKEKAEIGQLHASTITGAEQSGLVRPETALRELRQQARVSGLWTNITDAEIKDAENLPPKSELLNEEGSPGAEEA